jgi:putative transposase
LESFATLSDGSRILTPGRYRKAETYLAIRQRRVSRRKKGSHRRSKAVALLAKARQTVRQYDTTYHEDVQVANLIKHHHLAKSIADAGWAAFLSILAFKLQAPGSG